MLTLKHHFHLPIISFDTHPPLELTPVPVLDDNDELAQSITNDPINYDDNWTLDERPDTNQLEAFWNTVTDDLKHDL